MEPDLHTDSGGGCWDSPQGGFGSLEEVPHPVWGEPHLVPCRVRVAWVRGLADHHGCFRGSAALSRMGFALRVDSVLPTSSIC